MKNKMAFYLNMKIEVIISEHQLQKTTINFHENSVTCDPCIRKP